MPQPTFLFDITDHMDAKEASILAYESQFQTHEKNRQVVRWVRHMNGYMGSRIGVEYAEPFFVKEPLGLRSLTDIL